MILLEEQLGVKDAGGVSPDRCFTSPRHVTVKCTRDIVRGARGG